MKIPLYLVLILGLASCQRSVDKEAVRKEIFAAEKAFEKMAAEKSVAEAFRYFADEQAVIKRQNDTLISGKDNIARYYEGRNGATVNWTPDFIEVSDDGTLAYTYGKFSWKVKNTDGTMAEYKGVFHTVWKRQKNGEWRYVWD